MKQFALLCATTGEKQLAFVLGENHLTEAGRDALNLLLEHVKAQEGEVIRFDTVALSTTRQSSC